MRSTRSRRSRRRSEPEQYGIEHEAINGEYDVTTFEDLGNGQTRLTTIGNETMESAIRSGQVEGWNQILDKVAAVIADLLQADEVVDEPGMITFAL